MEWLLKNQKSTRENQALIQENYDAVKVRIGELSVHLDEISKDIGNQKKLQEEYEQQIGEAQAKLVGLDSSMENQNHRIADFDFLYQAYGLYLENRKLLEIKKKEEERLQNLQKLSGEKSEKLQSTLETKQHDLHLLEEQIKGKEQKGLSYEQYQETDDLLQTEDAREAENRYIAITSSISEEICTSARGLEKRSL